jgi:hypothetical protein
VRLVFIAGPRFWGKRPDFSAEGGTGFFIAGWRLCRKQPGVSVEGGVGFLAGKVAVLLGMVRFLAEGWACFWLAGQRNSGNGFGFAGSDEDRFFQKVVDRREWC